tara:strand:+ start:51736 stop:52956 length:1221 start_codon:yes stop_codon:yes gene_type:complete
MISNFIYKISFLLLFFFTISYLLLYSLFYKTDVIADSLDKNIKKSFYEYTNGYRINYSSLNGSFDEGFTLKDVKLEKDSIIIDIETFSFKLIYQNTALSLVKRLVNLKANIFDETKIDYISAKNLKLENESFKFHFNQIHLDQSKFFIKKITITYNDNLIELDQLETLGSYDLSLENINIKQFLDGNNEVGISRIDFSNNNYSTKYTYLDLNLYPIYSTINANLFNIKSIDNEFYYNKLKYYFNIDFNIDLIYHSGKVLINNFKVFDEKKFNKIDLFGEIFYKDLKVNVDCNTYRQMFFNSFLPINSNISIRGQDYTYSVEFTLLKTKKFVKSTVDKISGKFKFNLNNDIDYLIRFPNPVEMVDKDYKGTFYVSDIYNFEDIYKTQIVVDTERINPFRLNHFKRSD